MDKKPNCYSYLRFSSPEQQTGDSIRRQTEAAEKWAKENGFTLDDNLKMEDRGLSAYHGKNAESGAALGSFLESIKAGAVPIGSILLVESLDRLSRAEVKNAQVQFMQILQAGVDIVTMADGKHYSWASLDELQLILSIFIMSRAHEESLRKSQRVGAAWRNKHRLARERNVPVTAQMPAWLELDRESNSIQIIPERAELVKRIFQMALSGHGVSVIANKLNEEKIPSWGRSKYWQNGYINKILSNGTVYGLYRPSTKRDVKLEPIEGYYPVVIDKATFDQAKYEMKSRVLGAGRTGKVSNLFTHLVFCGYCGNSAVHDNKGFSPKGGQYLSCHKAKAKVDCVHKTLLNYPALEEAFLTYCREVDISVILGSGKGSAEIQALQMELASLEARIDALNSEINGTMATLGKIANESMIERLAIQLDSLGVELDAAQARKNELENLINTLSLPVNDVISHLSSVLDYHEILGKAEDEEKIALRLKLKHAIAKLVRRITIYPDGLQGGLPRYGDNNEGIVVERYEESESYKKYPDLMEVMRHEYDEKTTGRNNAAFIVIFRNGHSRLFKWDANNRRFTQEMSDAFGKQYFGIPIEDGVKIDVFASKGSSFLQEKKQS